jgi:hypothetical protein
MIVELQGNALAVKLFRALSRWQNVLPVLGSAALIGWLLWYIPPTELARAAALVDWRALVLATGLMVLCQYFWDALCLRWLFGRLGYALPYKQVLHARGSSYLLGAVNYELGQGMLAWLLAPPIPILRTLAGCLLLACHDLAILLTLGLMGSLLRAGTPLRTTTIFCIAGIGTLLAGALAAGLVRWKQQEGSAGWLGGWGWRDSGLLCLLRLGYYGIIFTYAAVGLRLCEIAVDLWTMISVVALVLLAGGLPISISGLGTRENALTLLLDPGQRPVVLAFSLTWSAGLMIGRLLLGLGHVWLPRLARRGTP